MAAFDGIRCIALKVLSRREIAYRPSPFPKTHTVLPKFRLEMDFRAVFSKLRLSMGSPNGPCWHVQRNPRFFHLTVRPNGLPVSRLVQPLSPIFAANFNQLRLPLRRQRICRAWSRSKQRQPQAGFQRCICVLQPRLVDVQFP